MNYKLSDEELASFESTLPYLASIVTGGENVDKALVEIAKKFNLREEERTIEILRRYIEVLQRAHSNPDTREDEYVADLMKLGIHQAPAELSVALVRKRLFVRETASERDIHKLELALPLLAETVAAGSDIDKSLAEIRQRLDLEEKHNEAINNCLKILLELHINPDVQEKDYLAKLTNLGITDTLAKRAVALVRGKTLPAAATLEDEIQFEISRRNYVRAVLLAEKMSTTPQNEIWRLKELALRQYATDYRNLPGFKKLVQDWEVPRAEVERILRGILEEQDNYARVLLQFDIDTMRHITLKEWIENALNSKW